MAKKKELPKAGQAWLEFAELASYLLNDDAPLNINEVPENNKFYGPAKGLAEELEIDWDNITQDESNRVMINLLGDYFMNIQESKDKRYIVDVTVREVDSKLKEKENEPAKV